METRTLQKDRYNLLPLFRRLKISQVDIAGRAGCSQQNVSQYIQGLHDSERVADAIEQLLKEREAA